MPTPRRRPLETPKPKPKRVKLPSMNPTLDALRPTVQVPDGPVPSCPKRKRIKLPNLGV